MSVFERRRNEQKVTVTIYENSVLGLGTTAYHVEIEREDGTKIFSSGRERMRTIWQAFDQLFGGSGSFR